MMGVPSQKEFHGRDNQGTDPAYFRITACCNPEDELVGFRGCVAAHSHLIISILGPNSFQFKPEKFRIV